MATPTSNKPLGTSPEPFDGKASNAETFWSNLANYYYLNDGMFSDESRKVSAALTHFKLGTPAGDWARECTNEALKKTPINYGTWATFKKTFAAHFIPAELALEASTIMHSLRQRNRPFNEWYQEWSTHASRAGVDESTRMYAFRVNLNQGLHTKLLGLSPQPATLNRIGGEGTRIRSCLSSL
jgi:Retrotransposon gag protein